MSASFPLRTAKQLIHRTLGLFGYQLERHESRLRIRKRVVLGAGDYIEIVKFTVGNRPRVIFVAGAYHGDGSKHLLKAFPDAAVYSFEPDPDSFAAMQANLASFSRSVGVQAAVGDTPGVATLNRNQGPVTNSMLPTAPESVSPDLTTESSTTVPVVTLDSFCRDKGIDIVDYVHADLQGFEMHMLRGAEQLLRERRLKLLLLEVSFEPYYSGQPTMDEIFRFLNERGYRFICTQGMFFEEGAKWPRSGNVLFLAP